MAESRATAREQELCETLRLEIEAYSHAINGFDAETAAVEQGTHPEFVRRCRVIEAAKDERQRTARQFYARQLATVDSLAARELEAAQLQFEEAIKRARAKQQMKEDKQRLKEDKANGRTPPEAAEPVAVAAVVTRSLRSSKPSDDAKKKRGASPTSMLIDRAATEAEIEQDLFAIATKHENMKRSRAQQLSGK